MLSGLVVAWRPVQQERQPQPQPQSPVLVLVRVWVALVALPPVPVVLAPLVVLPQARALVQRRLLLQPL